MATATKFTPLILSSKPSGNAGAAAEAAVVMQRYKSMALDARVKTMKSLKGVDAVTTKWHMEVALGALLVTAVGYSKLQNIKQKWWYIIDRVNALRAYTKTNTLSGLPSLPSGVTFALCLEYSWVNKLVFPMAPNLVWAMFAAYSSVYLADCMAPSGKNASVMPPTASEIKYVIAIYGQAITGNKISVHTIICNVFTKSSTPGANPTSTGLPLDICYPACTAPSGVATPEAQTLNEVSTSVQTGISVAMVGGMAGGPFGMLIGAGIGAIAGYFMSSSKRNDTRNAQIAQCKTARTTCFWPEGASTCDGSSAALSAVPACANQKSCFQQNKVMCLDAPHLCSEGFAKPPCKPLQSNTN
jgi:hypothetical protein